MQRDASSCHGRLGAARGARQPAPLHSPPVKLVVLREAARGERRVAVIPPSVPSLTAAGVEVAVETGAGRGALWSDHAYLEAGATVAPAGELLRDADVVTSIRLPSPALLGELRPGATYVGLWSPGAEPEAIRALLAVGASSFSLELLPRITRAQSMDVLSSQATVAGYHGALLAAARLGRFFPMLMTAAGTIPPAKVFVLGAGVAGLQAIATARRLGAVVTGHDVRAAAGGEVESLGARFVGLPAADLAEGEGGYAAAQPEEQLRRQREAIADSVAGSDAVITTAAIPGRRAPVVLTEAMLARLAPGSLVVDLAADSGGNTEVTKPGEEVHVGGATVLGVTNPPGSMPVHASQLYSRNVTTFLVSLVRGGALVEELEDEILESTCVTWKGQLRQQRFAPTAGGEGSRGGAGGSTQGPTAAGGAHAGAVSATRPEAAHGTEPEAAHGTEPGAVRGTEPGATGGTGPGALDGSDR